MKMDRDTLSDTIIKLVVNSLALDPKPVTVKSRLTVDLGADSLDFVDIIFLLEKKFSVKIREGEFDFLSRLDFSSPEVMQKGFLTRETVTRLEESLPALRDVSDPEKVTPAALFSFITIETLCLLVERKLSAA